MLMIIKLKQAYGCYIIYIVFELKIEQRNVFILTNVQFPFVIVSLKLAYLKPQYIGECKQ